VIEGAITSGGAVGADEEGNKHVLGLAEGACENQAVAKGLLEDVVRCGVRTDRKNLFVIDGSKALRAAVRDRPTDGQSRIYLVESLAYLHRVNEAVAT